MAHIRTAKVIFISALVALVILPVARAGDLPPGVKTLQANDYNMAYVESGSGRPLVMVHGALNDYRYWAAQMEPLSQRNRVIAVSLRHYFPERWDGKGGSFSAKQHVADLISFIKALNAGPIDLVGHSRGGYVALEVALTEPDLIHSLVLAEPAFLVLGEPALMLDESNSLGSTLQKSPEARTPGEAATRKALDRFEQGDIDGGLEILIDGAGGPGTWKNRPDALRQIGRDNAWTIKGTEEDQPRPVRCEELRRLKVPVLLVGGEKSPQSFGAILNMIEPCLERQARITIPNASHTMNRINPDAFNSAVTQFLLTH
jgi:pimeloyl-ACP methyl ester carboxylesterase